MRDGLTAGDTLVMAAGISQCADHAAQLDRLATWLREKVLLGVDVPGFTVEALSAAAASAQRASATLDGLLNLATREQQMLAEGAGEFGRPMGAVRINEVPEEMVRAAFREAGIGQ